MSYKLFLDDQCRELGMESFRYPPNEDNWFTAISSKEAIHIL